MKIIQTRKTLDRNRCEVCDCGKLTLEQKCHPGHGQIITYTHATGALTLTCAICDKYVSTILVASGDVV